MIEWKPLERYDLAESVRWIGSPWERIDSLNTHRPERPYSRQGTLLDLSESELELTEIWFEIEHLKFDYGRDTKWQSELS